MEKCILHVDANNFFASVECLLNPELRGYPIAVCGNQAERHGIVLAKNYPAKAYGVQTGETIGDAKRKCPKLKIVPPHYGEYVKFSQAAREIYLRFTDIVEPFGMDECWLDCTGSTRLFGSGMEIANKIRETVKFELGITVSIGVSFNKIFAKLGSDMKKPDAVTLISRDNFKETIWNLPASDLLFVGKATERKLSSVGIRTIGNLATFPSDFYQRRFGKVGVMLWRFANGMDESPVISRNMESLDKSCGHGTTTKEDMECGQDAWLVLLSLTQDIGHRLKLFHKMACGVSVTIRDAELNFQEWQCRLEVPTQSPGFIARVAMELLQKNYHWEKPLRAITVRAISLISQSEAFQLNIFYDASRLEKMEKLDQVVEDLRARFGKEIVKKACLLLDETYLRKVRVPMPNGCGFYRY